MKKFRLFSLVTAVLVTLVIAGCGVVVDVPITPATGYIRICANSPHIYGTLYVNGVSYGKIDGAGDIDPNCRSSVGPLYFGRSYFVEVIDYDFETGDYYGYITPNYEGQTIYLY